MYGEASRCGPVKPPPQKTAASAEKANLQTLQNHTAYQRLNPSKLPANAGQQEGEWEDNKTKYDLLVYDSMEVKAHLHNKSTPKLIYDSLEVEAGSQDKKSPTFVQVEHLDEKMKALDGASQLLYEDTRSDLLSDSSWTNNLKGGKNCHRYIADANSSVVETPQMAGNEYDHPFHLHIQTGPAVLMSSPLHHNQDDSKKLECFQPPRNCDDNSNCNTLQGGIKDKPDENLNKSCNLSENLEQIHALYIKEYEAYYEQETKCTQLRPDQGTNPSGSQKDQKAFSNKKTERQALDIVERNKKTLGRLASNSGSYVRTHVLRQEKSSNGKKISKEDKDPDPCLPQPEPQKMASSPPLPPTIAEDAFINLPSLHDHPHCITGFDGQCDVSPLYQHVCPGDNSQMDSKGQGGEALHRTNEKSKSTLKSQCSKEGRGQRRCPNDIHLKQLYQNMDNTKLLGSGHQPVLPPIGAPVKRKGPELSPVQGVTTTHSSSDGYLAKMDKQKQQKEASYKAYTLKDYKQLIPDTNLQGLGPDYTHIQKVSEKMKQQKLYSNVIREQNKKISKIPFLPSMDLEGKDKKVPRIKALEYAKTIAKPPLKPQMKPSQKQQSKGFAGLCFEDCDASELITLELLRKRHEEEKQRVQCFTKAKVI